MRIMFWAITILYLTFYGVSAPLLQAQSTEDNSCQDVRFMMNRDITPYSLLIGGGSPQLNAVNKRSLGQDSYADVWAMNIERPRNANNVAQEVLLTFEINELSGSPLEYAFMRGMLPYPTPQGNQDFRVRYQPLTGNLSAVVRYDGTLTLIIRRASISSPEAANYTLKITANANGILRTLPTSVQDVATNRLISPEARAIDGLLNIPFERSTVRTQFEGSRLINKRGGQYTQIFMPDETIGASSNKYTVSAGGWATQIDLIGGDFSVVGSADGLPRIYFLEGFDYRVSYDGSNPAQQLLTNLRFSDKTEIQHDWNLLSGLWVTDECTGFKLKDGRTFVATTPAEERLVRISYANDENFNITLNSRVATNARERFVADMSWNNVRPNGEVSFLRGVFYTPLVQEREFWVDSLNLRFESLPPNDTSPGKVSVDLRDKVANVVLDWVNLQSFWLVSNQVKLNFLDAPRGKTERDGTNLALFEALDDVIRILYKDSGASRGGERLLLGRAESYIELITPAGLPAWNATTMPDSPAFMPRALNNLGGDCYTVNTLLPEANCPSNGIPNPANGNLWLSFNDLIGYGDVFDLDLPRHYNSRAYLQDSPFGMGWTTPYLFDYNVLYNAETNSRPIEVTTNYRVSLDILYAPRGIVLFQTPSGSRHQFVKEGSGEKYRALTMPSWILERRDLRSNWVLRQDSGMVYTFDRAGRILSWGNPAHSRSLSFTYPRDLLNGTSELGENNPVIVTDNQPGEEPLRQLEIYFNGDHRISRAILRDLTLGQQTGSLCTFEVSCFETKYTYDNGLLVQVDYATGQKATYSYDANEQLIAHDDFFAPISRRMEYSYHEDGSLKDAQVLSSNGAIVWRSLSPAIVANDRKRVVVTGEIGTSIEYTYAYNAGDIFNAGTPQITPFALLQQSSPLAQADTEFEAKTPQTYKWENGLLTTVESRIYRGGIGQLGYNIQYTANTGRISAISTTPQGLPTTTIVYEPKRDVPSDVHRPTLITYADGTSESYEYLADGRVKTRVDSHGGRYSYDYQAPKRLAIVRQQDNATWEYVFNEIGLVASVSYYYKQSPSEQDPYRVSYRYDGLGRLLSVEDNVLGVFTVTYLPTQAVGDDFQTAILLQDPLGATTRWLYNGAGQLISESTENVNGLLQRMSYVYDVLGRLTESKILQGVSEVATQYQYQVATFRPPAKTTPTQTRIDGYLVQVILPSGRLAQYYYDALGRLSREVNEDQRTTDYDYSRLDINTRPGNLTEFALQVRQRSQSSGSSEVVASEYIFDNRQQLRYVSNSQKSWKIFLQSDGFQIRSIQPEVRQEAVSLASVNWGSYILGRPSGVSTVQAVLQLNSSFSVQNSHKPQLNPSFDFAGRQTSYTTGNRVSYNVAYCPIEKGGQRLIYGKPGQVVSCTTTDFDSAINYDYHGRVMRFEDGNGRRELRYSADTANNLWLIDVTFVANDASSGQWGMEVNSLGQVVRWRDESGFVHTYTYDTLGQLVALEVEGHPEKSFEFSYSSSGLLTRQVDKLGRGYSYNYNNLDQMVSQIDTLTADVTSFSYNPSGYVSSIISPSGGATFYEYNDPTDASRITRIVEPTGSQYTFSWDDKNNRIISRIPNGQTLAYTFDGTGLLWRIDDSLEIAKNNRIVFLEPGQLGRRTFEIYYNSDAEIVEWKEDVRTDGTRDARRFTIDRSAFASLQIRNDQANWTTTRRYGLNGELLAVNDVLFTYDPLLRLQTIQSPEREWRFSYSNQEPEMRLVDGFGITRDMRYDALYRLIEDTRGGEKTSYTYTRGKNTFDDDANEVVRVVIQAPNLSERAIEFDAGNILFFRQPQFRVLADSQQVSYLYTPDGLLETIVTEVCEEPAFESIRECIKGGYTVHRKSTQMTYDALGRPTRLTDENGNSQTFSYRDDGMLVSFQDFNGQRFNYDYDSANRLVRLISSTGISLWLKYTTLDDVESICKTRLELASSYEECVSANGGQLLESYGYDALGRLTSRRLYGGDEIRYAYNPSGLLDAYADVKYSYDKLGLLALVRVAGEDNAVKYASANRISEFGAMQFGYSPFGLLTSYRDNNQSMLFSYAPSELIATMQGAELKYELDTRGFVARIMTKNGGIYGIDYNDFTGVDFYPTNGANALVSMRRNLRGQTVSVLGDSPSYDYELNLDEVGVVKNAFFTLPNTKSGRTIVYGYDNDDRPLTMRVTDTTNLRVLFTQSLTYSRTGLIERETRQYGDSTQIIVETTYSNDSNKRLLVESRRIVIVRPFLASSALGLGFILLLRRRWKKDLKVLLTVGVFVTLALLVFPSNAQAEQTFNYAYRYDAKGNLVEIRETSSNSVCATYTYNSTNQLIKAKMDADGVEQTYTYDGLWRLKTAGKTRLTYRGSSHDVVAQSLDGKSIYYANLQNQVAPFAVDSAGKVTWLLSDGLTRFYQVYENEVKNSIWSYDLLGRYISIDDFGAETLVNRQSLNINPCRLSALASRESISEEFSVQPLEGGIVWDARTGLYFVNGRAFNPELGRFMQIDFKGPDALGNLYDGFQRTEVPVPVRSQETSIFMYGLDRLKKAEDEQLAIRLIDADSVKAKFLPSIDESVDPIRHSELEARRPFDSMLEQTLNLPLWLSSYYNQPMAYRDGRGMFRLPITQPGQGGLGEPRLQQSTRLKVDWLSAFFQGLSPIRKSFQKTLSERDGWLTSGIVMYHTEITYRNVHLMESSHVARIWGLQSGSPEDVLAQLPGTLIEPANASSLFDWVSELRRLPNTTNAYWIERAISQAIPTEPTLPPLDSASWFKQYFTLDMFGIAQALQPQLVDLASAPSYTFGFNPDWLYGFVVEK